MIATLIFMASGRGSGKKSKGSKPKKDDSTQRLKDERKKIQKDLKRLKQLEEGVAEKDTGTKGRATIEDLKASIMQSTALIRE